MPSETPIPPERFVRELSVFYSAYFRHDGVDGPGIYGLGKPLAELRPTWYNFTPEETEAIFHLVPGDVRGASLGCSPSSVIRLSKPTRVTAGLPHVLAEHPIAPMGWGTHEMRVEVEKQKKVDVAVRNVSFVQVEGVNHIVST